MSDSLRALFIAQADQAYADSQDKLDMLVAALVGDMHDRPADATDASDAPYWASSLSALLDRLEAGGGAGTFPTLMGVYMAAVYRLARQAVTA